MMTTIETDRLARTLPVNGRRTSIELEPVYWRLLEEMSVRERVTLNDLVSRIERSYDAGRGKKITLTAALRVAVALYLEQAATEDGHLAAGHGTRNPLSDTLRLTQSYCQSYCVT